MNDINVIVWDRTRFFINLPLNPYMYYFEKDNRVMWEECDKIAPEKFLRIPHTALFEFGGTHEEALSAL